MLAEDNRQCIGAFTRTNAIDELSFNGRSRLEISGRRRRRDRVGLAHAPEELVDRGDLHRHSSRLREPAMKSELTADSRQIPTDDMLAEILTIE